MKALWLILVAALMILIGIGFYQSRRDSSPSSSSTTPPKDSQPSSTETPSTKEIGPQMSAEASGKAAPHLQRSHHRDLIPGEHILQFKSPEEFRKFLLLARERGLNLLGVFNPLNAVRLRMDDDSDFEKLLAELPPGTGSYSNYTIRLPESPSPGNKETDLSKFNYLEFKDGALKWLGVKDNAQWGAGVTVAVLDTGIQNNNAFQGKNITFLDMLDPSIPFSGDEAGHGTAVASLIAGNGTGISPKVNLLSVRVLYGDGVGDAFTLAQGIIAAVDQGAKIINMSLGSFGDSPILFQAVQYAQQRGVVLVAATGNDAQDQISYPARYPGVVAVGGVDATGNHLVFSNSGNEVTLSAPGYGIYSAWTDDQMVSFTGTSASTPFVTGAIASVMSENPSLSGNQALDIINQYADDRGQPGPDPQYGNGILDPGWVSRRNQPGIYDVALADQFLENSTAVSGTVSFAVVVQNRGTEDLTNVQLLVSWDGNQQRFTIPSLRVGQSFKQDVLLYNAAYDTNKSTVVTSTVSLTGATDQYPGNNQMASSIRLVK